MNKTVLALLLATGCSTIALAQQKKENMGNPKIPVNVEKAFGKSHPNVKAKWEKEDGKYEAAFKENGHKMSQLFSADGTLEETEIEIPIQQLPATASQYIKQHQLGTIKEAAKITTADGSIRYEAEVKSGDVLFDTKGNFIKLQKD